MQHIGFIMDGNRTWAKERWLPTFEWHRRGYENAKKIIRLASKRWIPFISLWALSDDNIHNRSTEEVTYLFDLLGRWMLDIAKEAKADGNKVVVVWNRSLLPEKCQKSIHKAEKLTENETGTTVIIALGYGGQEEIIRAIHQAATSGADMWIITHEEFKKHIETTVYPPPDLIVRTGWHMRHSGFFLFHCPYSEYFFSETNWPDFSEWDLNLAIDSLKNADRKFWK